MRNDIEVGGTDDGIIAKVGTDTLDTTAQDLSGAVNEHEEDISQLNSSLTNKVKTWYTYNQTGDTGSNTFNLPTGWNNAKIVCITLRRWGMLDTITVIKEAITNGNVGNPNDLSMAPIFKLGGTNIAVPMCISSAGVVSFGKTPNNF
jgi:hypothetical protein